MQFARMGSRVKPFHRLSAVSSFTLMGSDAFRRFRWSWTIPLSGISIAAIRSALAGLERAIAEFAEVPYHDPRRRREMEQLLDDLEE